MFDDTKLSHLSKVLYIVILLEEFGENIKRKRSRTSYLKQLETIKRENTIHLTMALLGGVLDFLQTIPDDF